MDASTIVAIISLIVSLFVGVIMALQSEARARVAADIAEVKGLCKENAKDIQSIKDDREERSKEVQEQFNTFEKNNIRELGKISNILERIGK